MSEIKKTITTVILLDNEGKEVARHDINGIVFLASPSESEIAKLPKDDKGGFPIISYQFGEPQIVLALLKTLDGILPNSIANWLEKMRKIKENEIVLN